MKKLILSIACSLLLLSTAFAINLPNQLLPDEKDNIAVFNRISPLVVNVHRFHTVRSRHDNVYRLRRTKGSGFLWGDKGYVVTNYHVIRSASKIAVTLSTGQTVMASLVGSDKHQDIAVLKLEDPSALRRLYDIKPIQLADSTKLQVGQKTLAIGNPFGLTRTLTTGIVSALGRRVRGVGGVSIRNMIQTDASINPGNSGGPLLNSQGKLIGMNTMIYTRSGASTGVGFAVPANTIKRLVAQIIQYGKVMASSIGIKPISYAATHRLRIKGVIIAQVLPNSPAAKAGLRGTIRQADGRIRLGDIIVSINRQRIRSYDDLYNVLQQVKVGQTVVVRYVRDNKVHQVKMRTVNLS